MQIIDPDAKLAKYAPVIIIAIVALMMIPLREARREKYSYDVIDFCGGSAFRLR
ncbi:MAG: hypothetical protein LBB94_02950 [Clostridiales bacterium]|nr:hypothetical protein [Clostridiales bacterium]